METINIISKVLHATFGYFIIWDNLPRLAIANLLETTQLDLPRTWMHAKRWSHLHSTLYKENEHETF